MTQRLPRRIRCQSDKLNKPDQQGKSTYIPLSQAAKILFLDTSTIRYYIIRCRIRAFKSGGKWYVNNDDVQTFKQLQSHQLKTD